jgi:hypothetical protein
LVCRNISERIGQRQKQHQSKDNKQQQYQLSSSLLSIPPPIKFKPAFEELCNKHELLSCGIEKIDSLLKLTSGDRLSIIGNLKYTQILIARLCVNALLLSSPLKKDSSRFFHTSNVIFVDAGNSCDFYQYVNFARQYRRWDILNKILNNMIITRVFTIYQLADILINQLPKVIQQFDAKMVVVSDLLHMFVRDPRIEIKEAKYLLREIVNSITKITRVLEDDVLVIASISYDEDNTYHHHDDDKSAAISYNKTILPRLICALKL